MIHGRCECGAVSYEADCEISDFSHCHCSQCRRLHGAAYVTFAEVKADKFRYGSGEDHTKICHASAARDRGVCGTCGASRVGAIVLAS